MLDARELEEFPEMLRDMMSGKVESPELLKYYQAAAYSNMLYSMKHGYDFSYVGLFDNSVPTEDSGLATGCLFAWNFVAL